MNTPQTYPKPKDEEDTIHPTHQSRRVLAAHWWRLGMRIEYYPLTVSELNNATVYYNQQRAGLGDELRPEVYAAIERAPASPSQYAIVKRGMRRSLVHRFPYAVLFRIISEDRPRVGHPPSPSSSKLRSWSSIGWHNRVAGGV